MNDGALQSSGAQFRAERPKSGALSTVPKRSLNDAVAQWVAKGGRITVVESHTVIKMVGQRDQEYVLAEQRREQGEKSQAAIIDALKVLGRAKSTEIADVVGLNRGTALKHIQRLSKAGVITTEKEGGVCIYSLGK